MVCHQKEDDLEGAGHEKVGVLDVVAPANHEGACHEGAGAQNVAEGVPANYERMDALNVAEGVQTDHEGVYHQKGVAQVDHGGKEMVDAPAALVGVCHEDAVDQVVAEGVHEDQRLVPSDDHEECDVEGQGVQDDREEQDVGDQGVQDDRGEQDVGDQDDHEEQNVDQGVQDDRGEQGVGGQGVQDDHGGQNVDQGVQDDRGEQIVEDQWVQKDHEGVIEQVPGNQGVQDDRGDQMVGVDHGGKKYVGDQFDHGGQNVEVQGVQDDHGVAAQVADGVVQAFDVVANQ